MGDAWEEVTETNWETKGDVLMETSLFPHIPIRTLKRGTDMGGFEKVDWLARGLLKRKNLNELLGDEGIGKSLFWIHLAAVITSGKGDETLGITSIMAAAIEAGHAECTARTWRNRLNSIGAIPTGPGPSAGWYMAT